MAWNTAALTGAAFVGKLKPLNECFPPPDWQGTPGSAVVLGALFKMQRKFAKQGKFMVIEKITRH